MNDQPLLCPKCRNPIADALFNRGEFAPCPNCKTALQCEVFPALYAGPRLGRPGDLLVDASEASCFFHADKRAVVACESCGRFLCGLCDLDFAGRHICPSCLAAGRKKGTLDHYRYSWSGIALLMSVVPLVAFYPLSIVTAPAAIVIGIFGLRKPPGVTGRRRILSLVLALTFSLAEIAGWIWFGRTIVKTLFRG